MKFKKNILYEMFFSFFRIGLFTIGGGYAMLPMFHKELVEKYRWTTDDELLDFYAIAQSTPGIIAINVATLIGYKKKGFWGALFATIGVVMPSVIIILILASFFKSFSSNVYVEKAFMGIRVVVIVLIINASIKMAKKAVLNKSLGMISFLVFIAVAFFSLSPIYLIVPTGIVGLILYKRSERISNEV